MEWLLKLFGGSNPIGELADIADKFITTKEEKEILKQKRIELEHKIENYAQDVLTNRQKIDMASDNKLSKNVRPLSLLFLLSIVTLFAFTDGNIGEFTINEVYIKLYNDLLVAAFSFYFIGRSVVQGISLFKKK